MVRIGLNRFEPEPNQNHRFSSGFGHMARTEPGVQFAVRKFYPLNRTEPNFSITILDCPNCITMRAKLTDPVPVPGKTRTRPSRVWVWPGTGTGQLFLPEGYPGY